MNQSILNPEITDQMVMYAEARKAKVVSKVMDDTSQLKTLSEDETQLLLSMKMDPSWSPILQTMYDISNENVKFYESDMKYEEERKNGRI